MQEFTKMKLMYNLSRTISTCNINLNKYAKREGKFMTKIMREESGKRKWFTQNEKVPLNSVTTKKPAVPQSNRRNTVLNKLFMKHITDLMATGEVARSIVGKGIEISRVSVTPDFRLVNVFWLAKETPEMDALVEEVLIKAEGPLRHELSQLRVMGVVPIIKFVRDKQYIKFIEINRRLAMADFGEDFVPTDPTLRSKTTPVLNLKLPPEVWSDIKKLEQDIEESELESMEEPLPEMRNDVLGLDHARIMAKVKSSMDKSRAAIYTRSLNIVNPSPQNGTSSQVTEYMTMKQRNAAFSEFLTKRQLDEKRRKKYDMESNENRKDEIYFVNQEEFDDDIHDDYDDDIHDDYDDDIHDDYDDDNDLEDQVFDIDIESKKIKER